MRIFGRQLWNQICLTIESINQSINRINTNTKSLNLEPEAFDHCNYLDYNLDQGYIPSYLGAIFGQYFLT